MRILAWNTLASRRPREIASDIPINRLVNRVLGPVVTMHRGGRTIALLMFVYSLLAMASWNILRG